MHQILAGNHCRALHGRESSRGTSLRQTSGLVDIGPILDPERRENAKSLKLLARPTGLEPVFPP
jgi:hypothetical protein